MTQVIMTSLPRPITTLFISERLVYRSVQMSDLDTFYQIISEPGCMEMGHPFIPRPPIQKSMDDFVESYQKKALIFVFICLQEKLENGNVTAGNQLGLSIWPRHRSKLKKITVLPTLLSGFPEEYRGKGYGEEATKWAVDWAFNYAGVHRIELWSYSFNETAIRLWGKVGFKLEGRKRENVWFQRMGGKSEI
ncbi:hypothetical protein M441DRAFT_69605 [Trichoderma asperellum CBS 433.97]|uniref:N-acetyltransferase domain-containing protein n=1 Tax=Trichoderma asperellum (strain ATCC 204424 / CBS 433.97 / NBRC 101777) TaxID=1042311 RepID=A0A2T3Z8R0_TRIA4|nr:hypothetical protein M441DRAFT_69605 [Trichoderma asperellum CBS 433.97]PTB41187.1 hypothetical protein M441DRAFT_69605 [Trichoderma asperellum CBS 433.97]